MDAIEKRARELVMAEIPDLAKECFGYQRMTVVNLHVVMRILRAALTPPEEPDHALLVSMAMCLRHGFGLDTPEQQQSQLREMRKLWDEVMGRGYYSPANRERYVAMLAASPEVKP